MADRSKLDEMGRAVFPCEDSLCDGCGYRLNGLRAEQVCPECGKAAAESDPARRTGLPWQRSRGGMAWVKTVGFVVFCPGRGYGAMRVGGGNAAERWYLAIVAVVVGLAWMGVWWAGGYGWRWEWGVATAVVVVMLTYVEALGVAYFSRKRGWGVTLRTAERVSCYAAIGWVPAAMVCAEVELLIRRGVVRNYLLGSWRQWSGGVMVWDGWHEWSLRMLAAGLAMMWFEWLVWYGVRRVRYANWEGKSIDGFP